MDPAAQWAVEKPRDRGVAHLAKRVMGLLAIDPNNATAVIQGFGNVGSYAALELYRFGLKVIAVSDHTGALHDLRGLDIPVLMRHVGTHGSIAGFSKELQSDPSQTLTLPCDVLVPAAVERVIDARVAENLKCRSLAEGANGPTTPEADLLLEKRREEIFVIPDIICNLAAWWSAISSGCRISNSFSGTCAALSII